METHKIKFYKYSPLWYATMSMKAFCNGDRILADQYYTKGQEILNVTGSIYLPLPHYDRKDIFSISAESKNS